MKLAQKFTTYLMTLLCLSTATGLLTHETGIDKIPKIKSTSVRDLVIAEIIPETMRSGHAHAEHNPLGSLINSFGNQGQHQNPATPPREQLARKHMLQRYEPRGRHAFDNHCLPVIS